MTDKENKALLAVLSDDLQKKFEDFKGPAFKIDSAPLRHARGGQGGRGNNIN